MILFLVIQNTLKEIIIHAKILVQKGTYNSVSVDIIAENIEQVEILYVELAKIDGVKMVL